VSRKAPTAALRMTALVHWPRAKVVASSSIPLATVCGGGGENCGKILGVLIEQKYVWVWERGKEDKSMGSESGSVLQ